MIIKKYGSLFTTLSTKNYFIDVIK
jgi:hypothetical protein